MTQVRTDILLNGTRLEIHPSKLTKCGEIHINDDCTSAYLFCAFCPVENDDPDVNIFRTLVEFIDHIRWHRSDDLQYPQSPTSPKEATNDFYETIEDDSRSNLSVPRHDAADDIADWIAPPEELFELNTISNLIEIDTQNETTIVSNDLRNQDVTVKYHINCSAVPATEGTMNATIMDEIEEVEATEEEIPEITGEVFIDLLDLYKKCPCTWHCKTAAKTSSKIIDWAYKLLTSHYNKCAQQNRPVEYVKGIITQIKDCFLEEHKNTDGSASTPASNSPWYFSYLNFLLSSESDELDSSIFTDFICPVCTEERNSSEDLWEHLYQTHFDTNNNDSFGNTDESQNDDGLNIPLSQYPTEIIEKFIEVYRSQTRLWDRKNDEYYSRALRRQSYDMLLKILRKHDPTSNRTDVVRKINHLRTQFIYERGKPFNPKTGTKGGRSWLYDRLKFLANNVTKRLNSKPVPSVIPRPANFKKKVKSAKCPICATTFTDHTSWLSHMQSAHTSDEYQAKDGFFYCAVCGWQNKTKEILMRHLRNRHTYNLYKCTDCNVGFRLLSMLVEHRAKIHNDYLPFKCETCGDGFATRSSLRTHSTTHWCKEDLPHKCEYCGAKFSDRNSYNVHIRQHKLEYKHRCEICQQVMSTTAELREHSKTHLDDCPHLCDTCGRAFATVTQLTAHMNEAHGGIAYSCEECDKAFKTPKALSDHYEGHQSQHKCDICGTTFFRKQSLRKHKRLKHERVPYNYPT